MSLGFGIGGLVSGIAGSRSAKRNERNQRNRIENQTQAAIDDLTSAQQGFQQNPLLQLLQQAYMSRLGGAGGADGAPGSMGPYDTSGLFGQATQGVNDLFSGQYGLSNPEVQQGIINQTIDNQLTPAYQQAGQNQEAQFAARGIGRSGLAQNAAQNRDYQFARDSASIGRDVRTQGALQAMQDQMQKIQAAQQLFGLGEGLNLQTLGQAAGLGMGMQGAEGDLARAMAQARMQLAGIYAGLGPGTSTGQNLSQGLFGLAGSGVGQGFDRRIFG